MPHPNARRAVSTHRPRGSRPSLALAAAALACASAGAHGADNACAALARAARAGMAQARIHAAIDVPLDPAALKAGMKQRPMHSIVIDKVQYSDAASGGFRRTVLESPEMRALATDLAILEAEQGCQPLGSAKLAGLSTQVWRFATDIGRGEAQLTVWVDTASGLPVRAVSDEPAFDADTARTKQATAGKRVVGTHAYIYADAVKAPGPQGTADAAAAARLQALLKGQP